MDTKQGNEIITDKQVVFNHYFNWSKLVFALFCLLAPQSITTIKEYHSAIK